MCPGQVEQRLAIDLVVGLVLDAKVDLVLYGMAERGLVELARRLRDAGGDAAARGRCLRGLPGSAAAGDPAAIPADARRPQRKKSRLVR